MRFEHTCPTSLGGTPPHLDVLAEGHELVAVESKCTEWMQRKLVQFSDSYNRLRQLHRESSWTPWFEQMLRLKGQNQLFDAAQITKHAFGLLKRYPGSSASLVYLYWQPRNHEQWEACQLHRQEADDFASKVRDSDVRLVPLSYQELWAKLGNQTTPEHLNYLTARYDLVV